MAASGVDKVFDELGKMSVLQLVELKKKIEDEWGITAAAPVAMAAAPGAAAAGGDAAEAEEPTPRSVKGGRNCRRRPFACATNDVSASLTGCADLRPFRLPSPPSS